MEIREPRYKVGDKVYCKQYKSSATITGISDYSFNKDKYFYNVEWQCDDYLDEIHEDLLEPYIEKPKSVWDLQNGDTYYVVDYNDMNAFKIVFYNNEIDLNHMKLGNCFLTKEEAESELERVKIEAEMVRLGGRRNFKLDGDNYGIFYCEGVSVVLFHHSMYQGIIYFDTRKEAEEAIKTIGEDRIKKYIFGVEE